MNKSWHGILVIIYTETWNYWVRQERWAVDDAGNIIHVVSQYHRSWETKQQTVMRLLSWWIDDNLSVSQTRKAGVFQGQTKLKVISFRLQITAFYCARNLLWVEKYLVFIIWDDGLKSEVIMR